MDKKIPGIETDEEFQLLKYIRNELNKGNSIADIETAILQAQWPEAKTKFILKIAQEKPLEDSDAPSESMVIIGDDGESVLATHKIDGTTKNTLNPPPPPPLKYSMTRTVTTSQTQSSIQVVGSSKPSSLKDFFVLHVDQKIQLLNLLSRASMVALLAYHAWLLGTKILR